MFEIKGTNNSQIARVTGVNLHMIKYIKKKLKGDKE